MKKLYLLMSFLLLSSSLTAQQGNDSPVIESRSRMSFNETIETIKASAEGKGWKVLIVHDLQASLLKNGQEVLPVSVIEICKPLYSGNILKQDIYRALSVLMPCRVSVYEKTGGEVYISRMNVGSLKNSSFGEDAAALMMEAADEVEVILSELKSE